MNHNENHRNIITYNNLEQLKKIICSYSNIHATVLSHSQQYLRVSGSAAFPSSTLVNVLSSRLQTNWRQWLLNTIKGGLAQTPGLVLRHIYIYLVDCQIGDEGCFCLGSLKAIEAKKIWLSTLSTKKIRMFLGIKVARVSPEAIGPDSKSSA